MKIHGSITLTSARCANHHYRELNSLLDILLLANLYLRGAQFVRIEHSDENEMQEGREE